MENVLKKETASIWMDKLKPGYIFCYSLNADGKQKSSAFFIRGCDRDGNLLTGSVPGEAFVIALVDGKNPERNQQLLEGDVRPIHIVVSNCPKAMITSALTIFLLFVLSLVFTLVFFVLWQRLALMPTSRQSSEHAPPLRKCFVFSLCVDALFLVHQCLSPILQQQADLLLVALGIMMFIWL